VILDGEFPSVRYVYQALASRLGAEVVTVPSPRGDGLAADESRIVSSIDDRTAIVAISHILYKSAFVVDVAPIAKKCRQVGALLVLDAYESVGTMPVSVDTLGVDVLVGGVLKWLCGGAGAAFLYVRPERRKSLTPALTGWLAHAAPFAFEPPPIRHRDDAFRFLLGTPAIPALYAAREGPRIVREAGPAAIREKSLRQTALVAELARRRGFRSAAAPEPSRRGGTVAVEVPNGPRGLAGAQRPRRRRGLPPGSRHPALASLLHGGRGDRSRLPGDRRNPRERRLGALEGAGEPGHVSSAEGAAATSVAGRRFGAFRAEGGAALLLAAATVGLWIASRGKWSDAIIDTGTEWIYADSLARGDLLYRDLIYWFGPFTPYFQAAFLRVFGSGFPALVIAGVVGSLATLAALYALLRRVTGRWEAIAWTGLAVAALVFLPDAGARSSAWDIGSGTPRTFTLIALSLASRPSAGNAKGRAMVAGLLCGLAGLCRTEWGLIALAGVATAQAVLSRPRWMRDVFLSAACAAGLFGAGLGAFVLAAGGDAVLSDGHVLLTGISPETRKFLVHFLRSRRLEKGPRSDAVLRRDVDRAASS
jgi:hypothetical protein